MIFFLFLFRITVSNPNAFSLFKHNLDVIDPNPTATLAKLTATSQSTSRGGNQPRRGIRSRKIDSDEDSD